MKNLMSIQRLAQDSLANAGTGGCSQGSAALGFRPAFFDCMTCAIHLSRFANGRPAPIHVLDGLPDDLIVLREAGGRVAAARASVIAGFERGGYFYTRSAAARAVAEWGTPR